MNFDPNNSLGAFVQTTQNFQVDDKQLRILLSYYISLIVNAVNIRDIAQYDLVELLNGQQFFNPGETAEDLHSQEKRPGFRKTFSFDDASLVFNHDISGITICTYIGGGAVTNTGIFIPIPYTSTVVTNQIQVNVTATQVIITKGATAPVITDGILVVEYLKN